MKVKLIRMIEGPKRKTNTCSCPEKVFNYMDTQISELNAFILHDHSDNPMKHLIIISLNG